MANGNEDTIPLGSLAKATSASRKTVKRVAKKLKIEPARHELHGNPVFVFTMEQAEQILKARNAGLVKSGKMPVDDAGPALAARARQS